MTKPIDASSSKSVIKPAEDFVEHFDTPDARGKKDNALDVEEFRRGFEKLSLNDQTHILLKHGVASADELFDLIDNPRDMDTFGKLTASEIAPFLAPLTTPRAQGLDPDPQIDTLFEKVNLDTENTPDCVTKDEFIEAFEDKTDGFLQGVLRASGCKDAEELFAKIDKINDGLVTLAELDHFVASLEENPTQRLEQLFATNPQGAVASFLDEVGIEDPQREEILDAYAEDPNHGFALILDALEISGPQAQALEDDFAEDPSVGFARLLDHCFEENLDANPTERFERFFAINQHGAISLFLDEVGIEDPQREEILDAYAENPNHGFALILDALEISGPQAQALEDDFAEDPSVGFARLLDRELRS